MEYQDSSHTASRRWLAPLLLCWFAFGGAGDTARITAAVPTAGAQGSAAVGDPHGDAAAASHDAPGNPASRQSAATAKKPGAGTKATGKAAKNTGKTTTKTKPTTKAATKKTAAQPGAQTQTQPEAAAAQTTRFEACDAVGKQVEVVNLTFVHSTVGAAGSGPATGDGQDASSKESFADKLNSLFQVPAAPADNAAKKSGAAPESQNTGSDPSTNQSGCRTGAPACFPDKSGCHAGPTACPAKDAAAAKPPAPPLCPLVQDMGYGRLLLHGTPAQNLAIKRAIAAIDVAWPQVQLNMWAIQVSGRDDQEVSKEVRCIRDRISWTRDAIVKLQDTLKQEVIDHADCAGALPPELEDRMAFWREGPMSLNEALILLVLRDENEQKRIIGKLRSFVHDDGLGKPRLAGECAAPPPPDPENSRCRGRCAKCGRVCTDCPDRCASAPAPPQPFSRLEAAIHMPGSPNLCSAFGKFWTDYREAIDLSRQGLPAGCDALSTATDCLEISTQPGHLDDLARSRNRIDRVLRTVMDAYAADMQDLLFDPFLDSIRDKERTTKNDDGVSLVGRTRIVVTSGMEAALSPEMASYVETTRPKPFGTDLLNAAFPAKKSDSSTAAGLERIVGGIPQVQAALLAAALLSDTEPRYLKVAPGIGVDVRPVVLPDESEARLTIDARFGVDTQELSTAKRDDLWAQPPPASIKSHHITTDATVSVFDLFDISSFSIDTVTPQAPYYIPILGRLPILGPAFQIPRKNKAVRHESVILVNTVVLPRSTLLTEPF